MGAASGLSSSSSGVGWKGFYKRASKSVPAAPPYASPSAVDYHARAQARLDPHAPAGASTLRDLRVRSEKAGQGARDGRRGSRQDHPNAATRCG